MNAPESFIEQMRSGLVVPRRNVDRARRAETPADREYFLAELARQIADLEAIVAAAVEQEICTCSCGHVHYLHGDSA